MFSHVGGEMYFFYRFIAESPIIKVISTRQKYTHLFNVMSHNVGAFRNEYTPSPTPRNKKGNLDIFSVLV